MTDLKVTGATTVRKRTAIQAQTTDIDVDSYDDDDLATPELTGDGLTVLQALAEELIQESRAVADADRTLKQAKARLADVQEHRLPDLMERHGLQKFEFQDRTTGTTLIIKFESGKWRVSMPPQKDEQGNYLTENATARKEILGWVREIGSAGAIKKNVEMPVGQMSDEAVAGMVRVLKLEYPQIDVAIVEGIAPATLTALVNRRLKDGKPVHEKLQVKPVRQAKVVSR